MRVPRQSHLIKQLNAGGGWRELVLNLEIQLASGEGNP